MAELTGRTVGYGYDDLYRLSSETIACTTATPNCSSQTGLISYAYDPVGNRLQLNSTVPAIPAGMLNYDANDRLSTDLYDDNGNTLASGGIGNVYDFEDHLVQHGAVTIVYDGDGNRVEKTAAGVTTSYLVDTNNLTGYAQVVEELQNAAVVRAYTYGLDLISQRQLILSTWNYSYYGYDGHGSVRSLTDSAGTVTDTYTYDAFGNLIERTGSTPNNYLYSGEQFDPDLGLYYNRARYLDVRNGRFWGMDTFEGNPQSPASLHKYLYASADPVNVMDPSGTESLGEIVDAAAIYVQNVFSSARAAFAAGGAAIGVFFNGIGAFAQNTARQVIQLFTRINSEVVSEEIEQDVEITVGQSRRFIDFYVRARDGISNLLIEAKYSLPKGGAALVRLAGQARNALESGRASQVVVWSLKEPTIKQITTVLTAIGAEANQVQFVHGVEGLYRYLEFYFRI